MYLGTTGLTLGFMYCMILARRVRSISSSSSITAAFLFSDPGGVGAETRITVLAIRVRCGSGSKHNGGAVANYIHCSVNREMS